MIYDVAMTGDELALAVFPENGNLSRNCDVDSLTSSFGGDFDCGGVAARGHV